MLYQIQNKDLDKAARTLGNAFMAYPFFKYVFPDDQYRERKINHLFSFILKLGMLNGEVFASSKNIEAVSIWIYPGAESSLLDYLKAGIIALYFKVDFKSILRFSQLGLRKERKRSTILSDHYCFLNVIGVDPQFQKKGFGRILLESKLNHADTLKTSCYLETSDQENIPFYKKFGFKLIHEYELMAMQVYCMHRSL